MTGDHFRQKEDVCRTPIVSGRTKHQRHHALLFERDHVRSVLAWESFDSDFASCFVADRGVLCAGASCGSLEVGAIFLATPHGERLSF